MNALEIPWESLDDTYQLLYSDKLWSLTVEWLDEEYRQRRYWLSDGMGFRTEIKINGGVYTALDIATEFISQRA